MSQNPLLEPYDDQIEKSDKYIKTESAAFKFDGSPDETIVREVKTWFLNLISDEDILHDTRIDIDVLAKIVAESGARVTDFETLFYKKATQESKVLDIGVLRYPDIDHPFFKVYRIQLTAWSTCERILFQQSDTHGITGEFSCRKYKPRASVIQKLSEKVTQKAVQEAEDLFS
ncbi:hypothetical protein KP509_11G019400 [Ceratopteris richardii]|nr:hypothetical protein KP509_11G019400 [Ceratopteris richardii]